MDARTKEISTIDSAIDRALAENRIVGAVVLVAHDGAIVYHQAAGLADRERGSASDRGVLGCEQRCCALSNLYDDPAGAHAPQRRALRIR